MTQPHVDVYTWPHKAQRRFLFLVASRAGATDFAAQGAAEALVGDMTTALGLLTEHAAHEETFLHPVMSTRLPEIAARLHREHEDLHALIGALDQRIQSLGQETAAAARRALGLEIYQEYNAFLSRYLDHLHNEEVLLPTFWEMFTPAELGEVMTRFRASRPPDEALADVERMLPALAPQERALLLDNMRASAPPEAFKAACEIAARVLAPRDFKGLQACVDLSIGH